jgi:hypothetical protein
MKDGLALTPSRLIGEIRALRAVPVLVIRKAAMSNSSVGGGSTVLRIGRRRLPPS